MASAFGAGAGADMLQDVLRRKFAEQFQAAQMRNMAEQRALQAQGQQIALRGQDQQQQQFDMRRQDAMAAAEAEQAATQEATQKAAAQNHLRAAIQGSLNVAGSDDPNGALATRNALRVALTAGGAKDIPQEPAPEKPTVKPLFRLSRDGKLTQLGEVPTGAQVVNEPAPEKQAGAGGPRMLSANQEANLTTKLAGDWTKASTATREMERQYGLMQTGIDRYAKGDKNGGSQAVLVTFQKILDPTSVVRESEFARSAEGVSMLQRLQGYVERYGSGGAGVPEPALREMVKTAGDFLANAKRSTDGQRKRIAAMADKYGIAPELVFDDSAPAAAAPPAPAAPAPAATTGGGQPNYRQKYNY